MHVHGFDPCSNHEVLSMKILGLMYYYYQQNNIVGYNVMVSRIASCFWETEWLPTDSINTMHSYFLATYQWCFKA